MLGKRIHGWCSECSDTPAKNKDYQEHSAFQVRTAFWENVNTISPMQLILKLYTSRIFLQMQCMLVVGVSGWI